MPKQRRIIIKTDSYKGILFDEKDTVTAYQLLGRATFVNLTYNGKTVTKDPDGDSIDIVLVDASSIKEPETEEPAPPAPPAPSDDNEVIF